MKSTITLAITLLMATTSLAQNEIYDFLPVTEIYCTGCDYPNDKNLRGYYSQDIVIIWVTKNDTAYVDVAIFDSTKKDDTKSLAVAIVNPFDCEYIETDKYPKICLMGFIISPFHEKEYQFLMIEKMNTPNTNNPYVDLCFTFFHSYNTNAKEWNILQFYGRTQKLNHSFP